MSPATRSPSDPPVVEGHLTSLYRSRVGQFDAAVPVLTRALDADGHLLYLVDDASERQVAAALGQAGVDVDAARSDGRLRFRETAAIVPEDDPIPPDALVRAAERVFGDTASCPDDLLVAAEFTGDHLPGPAAVTRAQRAAGRVASQYQGALCQFDRTSLGDDATRRAIRTAPRLVPIRQRGWRTGDDADPSVAGERSTDAGVDATDAGPESTDSRPESTDSRPESTDFRPESTDFRSESTDSPDSE